MNPNKWTGSEEAQQIINLRHLIPAIMSLAIGLLASAFLTVLEKEGIDKKILIKRKQMLSFGYKIIRATVLIFLFTFLAFCVVFVPAYEILNVSSPNAYPIIDSLGL